MARKANPHAAPVADDTNTEAITASIDASDERALMLAEIDNTYGAGLSYAKDRLIAEAAFFINHGSESFFEAGKRLILLKEHEGHGGFMNALETLGIEYRTANRFMTVAAKFSNLTTLSNLNRSKLIELAVLGDDEIAELDQGGTVAGLKVDDIDRMSVRELKAALRAEKDEHSATREQVASKNQKIDELDRRLTKRSERQAWDDELKAFTVGLREISNLNEENLNTCLAAIMNLEERLTAAPDAQRSSVAHLILDEVNRILTAAAQLQNYVNDAVMVHASPRAVAVNG